MSTQLASLSEELAELTRCTESSVVAVKGRRGMYSSGVHWRKNLIVAAEHTIRKDEGLKVVLPDGKEVHAKLVGRDQGTDLALLQMEDLNIPAAGGNRAADLLVGEIVLVVGRSPNSGVNASMGIVSAVSGPWRTWRGGNLDRYIRLDATIFLGSSGGAVVNHEGKIIGIATEGLSRVAGLAIPGSSVDTVVDALLKHGAVPRGYLGVGLQQVALPESFTKGLSLVSDHGLMVFNVESGGPAEKSGILVGDIVLEVDGRTVEEVEELQSLLGGESVGKEVSLKLIRGGELKNVAVKVGERLKG